MAALPNGDAYTTDILPYRVYPLEIPTLLEIAEVLQNGMQPLFQRVNVDIASCPNLSTAPYNLAGVGLGGYTSIVELFLLEPNVPWNQRTRDFQEIFTTSCRDAFVIGTSYATKPSMPYYGHLIMNATYRAPMDIRNESRLIFAERGNGQTRIEKLTDPNQMKYTNKGIFFVSEGRGGHVIRVRAKGRKTINTDIITVLYEKYENDNKFVALGGVLKMTNGSVACNLMWDDYEEPLGSFDDIIRRQQCAEIHLESDMIAIGTIINDKPVLIPQEQRYGVYQLNQE
ncbi:PREDICTED: ester hydrolase C11orf54 homolog [Acromyrmex echinatior]|uniref:ester hydrolase C11orf54 homolog n=1 Tax=Acromyrmex echinatior TaxID=103372 RepID=UPI000580B90E|nr:PREDICTED: ester hydrolase C11orf54 homolog [Acromyrmex echinatior]